MDLKKIIHTFEGAPSERRVNANQLALFLDGEVYVGGTDTLTNFINICKLAGDSDLLYLEDDVQICSEFENRLKSALEECPKEVVSFFTCKELPRAITAVSFKNHKYSQCVYIPNFRVKQLIDLEPKARKIFRFNDWERIFTLLDGYYYQYFPHLVQQFNWKSTIVDGWIDQSSKYFIG